MRHADGGTPDPQSEEGRRNRRVAVAGIVVNGTVAIVVALIAAFVTAHSKPIITSLGGKSVVTLTASPPVSSPHPQRSSPAPTATQLPLGPAFTQGSFTISGSGIDLDRNPPEAGNVSDGTSEIIGQTPAALYFYGAQETVQWNQAAVPTQAECHHDELSNGVTYLHFDLTPFQQSGQQAKFCILTDEGRDAYVVISGRTIVSNSPIPSTGFVWATKIPVS